MLRRSRFSPIVILCVLVVFVCVPTIDASTQSMEERFFHAVESNNFALVQELLECGADVNWKNPRPFGVKETPLHVAARNNLTDMAEFLINKGANVNATDEFYRATPLHWATDQWIASENRKDAKDSGMVELLISKGANINAKSSYGKTPLHNAISYGHEASAKVLLLCPLVDVNAKDIYGYTPLHAAAESNQVEIATLLATKGADVGVTDCRGATPLHYAARESSGVVDLLLKYNVHVDPRDLSGYTPLMSAVSYDNTEAVRALLKKGASIKSATLPTKYWGFTALDRAAERKQTEIAEMLISYGASVNSGCGWEMGPLQYAAKAGSVELVEMLIAHGAKVNQVVRPIERELGSPLHYAAGAGHIDVVKALLRHGADINIKDSNGFIPRAWAERTNQQEVIKLLGQA